MAAVACGLDFGTSNTTLGLAAAGGAARLAPLEGDATTLPSAIFFDFETAGRIAVGRAAVDSYIAGTDGRFMRALKSVLGTGLIDEDTMLQRTRIGFRQVIARYLSEVKRRAEAAGNAALDAVVHGRPVHFVDGDAAADKRAQAALAEIAGTVGFREISFQYEPIAAALDYEADRVAREEIALIADIGGGTSDFSVIRLSPERRRRTDRSADILANDGVRVGGTDYDRDLSLAAVMPHLGYRSAMQRPALPAPSLFFSDLATWSKINFLYAPKPLAELRQIIREAARPELLGRLLRVLELRRGHSLAIAVEEAKIALSGSDGASLPLGWIEPGLVALLDRAIFETATRALTRRIAERTAACLRAAAIPAARVDAVFLTGGSTLVPQIRGAILAAVPGARPVEGDKFGSVGLGLTIEAARRYG